MMISWVSSYNFLYTHSNLDIVSDTCSWAINPPTIVDTCIMANRESNPTLVILFMFASRRPICWVEIYKAWSGFRAPGDKTRRIVASYWLSCQVCFLPAILLYALFMCSRKWAKNLPSCLYALLRIESLESNSFFKPVSSFFGEYLM